MAQKKHKTSWESVGSWYDQCVGKDGQHYHQKIIIPGVLERLRLDGDSSLLDLACGQGILGRSVSEKITYCGVDVSPSLIQSAKKLDSSKSHTYYVGDITKRLPAEKTDFSHAAIILALQNIEDGSLAIAEAGRHLKKGGRFVIVMNHPCYRIPRQSSWGVDDDKKLQYRRVDRYMSPMAIPITANPGKGSKSDKTWSYHHPIGTYFSWLQEGGFVVEALDEWCSDKVSRGGVAKMENRSRKEFPLFLCITAIRL
ncbi:MAG: class I SAM-dependent methyltransferase [Chlamydiales bacterium]|nr:class I SAM-dependent methyltransferase [Chlamydiia bacterium]MCP5507679.1 class I SAM-dependent methyltransferase [Chlamydiales bacterium]